MAAITQDDITAMYPDVVAVPAFWIAWVNTKIAVNNFDGEDGLSTKGLRCSLAAHFSLVGGPDSGGALAGGAVASETEGGISRSYATGSIDISALNATAPGRTARQLIRLYAAGGWIATPD